MMQLRDTYTVADFARFQYFHVLRRMWTLLWIAAITESLLLVVALTASNRNTTTNVVPLIVMIAVWLGLIFVVPYVSARRIFSKQPYLGHPVSITFTNTGYEMTGTGFSSKVDWNVLHVVAETKSQFLLYHSPNMAAVVPKRFFTDAAEVEAMKRLAIDGIAPKKITSATLLSRFV
jgi:hypothetical protein